MGHFDYLGEAETLLRDEEGVEYLVITEGVLRAEVEQYKRDLQQRQETNSKISQ